MLTLFDLLSKKELGPLERELLRDRLAIIEGQRNRSLQLTGSGSLTLWGDLTVNGDSVLDGDLTGGGTLATGGYTLTVPATGTAVVGSGTANRLMVWTGANSAGSSDALSELGDLAYYGSGGGGEVSSIVLEESDLKTVSGYDAPPYETLTLTGLTTGDTAQITIDVWLSGAGTYGASNYKIELRRSNYTGAVLVDSGWYPITGDTTGHLVHWQASYTDTTPPSNGTYVLVHQTTKSENGTYSDYRYLKIAKVAGTEGPLRLPIGSEDQFLRVSSGAPVWETVSVITGVSDTASVDLTVTGSTLSAAVLAAGVDHNSLLNYASNRHFLQTDITNISTGLATGLVKVTTGTGALSIVTDNSANWDTAYGWGNHASAGYVPGARTITEGAGLAGNTYDLSANRTLAMGTPSTLTVSTTNSASGTTHAHAITSSSNPGAAARLLASNSTGGLQLTRIGIGIAPLTIIGIYNSYASTDPAGTVYGINNSATLTLTAASASRIINGYYSLVGTTAAAGVVASNSVALSSVNRNIFLAYTSHVVGYIAQSNAGQFEAGNQSTGRIIELAGNRINTNVNSGGGTVDINYGLLVEDQTVGTANYAIQTKGAAVVLNENGTAAGGFRAESDTEPSMLDLVASTDKLYLGGQTNGIEISKGGDLLLLGTAKYERHVQIPAFLAGTPANQPNQSANFTVGGLQFSSTVSQITYVQWEIPDDWDGTNVYIEIDWYPDSGAMSGTDTIKWDVEYRSIAEGELINQGTSVTVSTTDSADYSQYQTKHARHTLVYNNANQPLTVQDHIYFKVSRDVAVANDFAGTVTVPAFEIIYNSKGFPTSN